MEWRLAGPLGLCCVLAGAALNPGGVARAQDPLQDPGHWRTYAGGHEILTLASAPGGGRLYAGTEGGGLVVWDVATRSFEQFLFPQQPGLLSNHVHDLAFDAAGNAWLATAAGVSLAPAGLGGSWSAYGVDDGLPHPLASAIAVDPEGTVWVGTPEGVAYLQAGAQDFVAVPAVAIDDRPTGGLDGPGANHVRDIAVDGQGRVYLAHGRGKLTAMRAAGADDPQPALSIYDPATRDWRHLTPGAPGSTEPGPPSDKIMSLSLAPDGLLWMATWAEGVVSWDRANGWTQHRRRDGLCGDNVWAIRALGRDVWAACGVSSSGAGAGVARWDGRTWEVLDEDRGWPTETITDFADVDGKVFAGTNGFGLKFGFGGLGILPLDGRGEPEAALTTGGPSPAANDVTAALFLDDGTLWAGTLGQGLLRRDPGAPHTWHQYTFDNTDGALVGDTITDLALRQAPDGTPELWVATAEMRFNAQTRAYDDGGVSRLNLRTWAWEPSLRVGSPPEMLDGNIGSLAVATDGKVWMGTGTGLRALGDNPNSGRGAMIYDPVTGVWERLSVESGEQEKIAGNTVPAMAAGPRLMWLATSYSAATRADQQREGGGVTLRDAQGMVSWRAGEAGFVSLRGSDTKDRLVTGDVASIALDADGMAWAGTYEADVLRLPDIFPLTDAVVNRQVATQGQIWDQPGWENAKGSGWVSALLKDSQGRMWAGTSRGHMFQNEPLREHSPAGAGKLDSAVGGAAVWTEASRSWTELTPDNSGLAANAITVMAVDPTTGYVWVGTEDGGFSVYEQGAPWQSTVTPGPTSTPVTGTPRPTVDSITATPGPGVTAVNTVEGPPIRTVGPGGGGGGDDDDPRPEPPPEVPEPATWLMLAMGLGAAAGLIGMRRRQLGRA